MTAKKTPASCQPFISDISREIWAYSSTLGTIHQYRDSLQLTHNVDASTTGSFEKPSLMNWRAHRPEGGLRHSPQTQPSDTALKHSPEASW